MIETYVREQHHDDDDDDAEKSQVWVLWLLLRSLFITFLLVSLLHNCIITILLSVYDSHCTVLLLFSNIDYNKIQNKTINLFLNENNVSQKNEMNKKNNKLHFKNQTKTKSTWFYLFLTKEGIQSIFCYHDECDAHFLNNCKIHFRFFCCSEMRFSLSLSLSLGFYEVKLDFHLSCFVLFIMFIKLLSQLFNGLYCWEEWE